MKNRIPGPEKFVLALFAIALLFIAAMSLSAQSSRPRRVKPSPTPTPTPETLLGPPPKSAPSVDRNAPLLDVKPAKPVGDAPASSPTNSASTPTTSGPDTTHAFQLFQQHQYAQAAREAKAVAATD